jgi:hypothetical protein
VTTATTTTTEVPVPTSTTVVGLLAKLGAWVPAGRTVGGTSAVQVALFQVPASGALVGAARLDTSRLRIVPYAGTSQPGGTWSSQGSVPPALRPQLVAAFNGGFQFNVAGGGWYADGRAGIPLRDGAASLVVFSDGSAIVGQWGRDATLTPTVTAVRQNLTLLVDRGVPVPSVNSPWMWGAVLHGGVRTWRSGLGDDGHGHLLYVGGPGLTPADLAGVLIATGATRAMELDINPEWVLFATFADGPPPGTTVPAKLLPAMTFGGDHFFVPEWRDFVVALAKPSSGAG